MTKIVLADLQNSLYRYETAQGEWLDHIAEYHTLSSADEIDTFIIDHQQCFKIVCVLSMFFDRPPVDLSGFDLVIVVNPELIQEPLGEHLALLRQHFSNDRIITVTSEHLSDCVPNEHVYRYPYFLTEIPMINKYVDTSATEKPKLFDALLGLNKEHRQFIFNSLRQHNLIDKCYLSLIEKDQWIYYSDDLRPLETKAALEAMEKNNGVFNSYINTSFQQYYPISRQMPFDIYKNSWYSIVAETNCHTWTFISEKTAKPLYAKRIFVMFAAQYHLKKLREWGFQTFDSIIDESYDVEIDRMKRYKMAFDQVLALSRQDPLSVYRKITPILEHNHDLICNRQHFVNPLRSWLTDHIIKPN
jgi:hypothetical protein